MLLLGYISNIKRTTHFCRRWEVRSEKIRLCEILLFKKLEEILRKNMYIT